VQKNGLESITQILKALREIKFAEPGPNTCVVSFLATLAHEQREIMETLEMYFIFATGNLKSDACEDEVKKCSCSHVALADSFKFMDLLTEVDQAGLKDVACFERTVKEAQKKLTFPSSWSPMLPWLCSRFSRQCRGKWMRSLVVRGWAFALKSLQKWING